MPALCMLIRPKFLGTCPPDAEISVESSRDAAATAAAGHGYHEEHEKIGITENEINNRIN